MGRLAELRRRFGALRLASKLAWLSAGLTAIFVASTLIPLSLSTRDTARQIVARQLGQTQRALIANQARELERIEHAATLIGQNSAMLAAIADERTQSLTSRAPRRGLNPQLVETVRHELEKELRNVEQDLIVIADDSGRVFAAASPDSASIPSGTDLSSLEAVRVALDPDAPADTGVYGVVDVGRGAFSIAAVPLVSAGRTLGVVLLGERLDSAYLASMKSAFDGDVVVTAGNRAIASTVPIDASGLANLERAREGEAPQPTVVIAGDAIVAAPLSLGRDRSGDPVTLWLLQRVIERSGVLTRQIVLQFILYGLAAVLLSGLGAALVAQSVLRPLDRFIAYMKRVNPMRAAPERVDLGDASPEIRTLDESFASLMDSLRESEEQLRQSQKLEAIGTLAGGVAHDFNNLLTVISGYTELAMIRNPGDEQLRSELSQVMDASQRASRLTHQLLAFSRKQVLEPTVLDINEVIDSVVPMLRRLIGEHIHIVVEPAGLDHVVADRGQLEQVIINLVVNARDAMPTGGTITIRTSRGTLEGAPAVSLSVSDTGTGIPPEIRDRIFEPFFTTKALGKGTGLGLSMVYGIVTQSGGTIDLESEQGRGTTFTIRLPAGGEADAVAAPEAESVAIPRGTETILVVEDEPELRELARRTLEAQGYTVIAPEHTEDALAIAISRNVDLLLADIVMPVMSGPMIVRRLADVGARPAVVYMSGYADETLADYRLEEGATLLRKPFSPSQLARVVRSSLDLAVR